MVFNWKWQVDAFLASILAKLGWEWHSATISGCWRTLSRPSMSRRDPCARIAELAREKRVEAIIVGVPRNMDGSFGPAALKAREFIERFGNVPCKSSRGTSD